MYTAALRLSSYPDREQPQVMKLICFTCFSPLSLLHPFVASMTGALTAVLLLQAVAAQRSISTGLHLEIESHELTRCLVTLNARFEY